VRRRTKRQQDRISTPFLPFWWECPAASAGRASEFGQPSRQPTVAGRAPFRRCPPTGLGRGSPCLSRIRLAPAWETPTASAGAAGRRLRAGLAAAGRNPRHWVHYYLSDTSTGPTVIGFGVLKNSAADTDALPFLNGVLPKLVAGTWAVWLKPSQTTMSGLVKVFTFPLARINLLPLPCTTSTFIDEPSTSQEYWTETMTLPPSGPSCAPVMLMLGAACTLAGITSRQAKTEPSPASRRIDMTKSPSGSGLDATTIQTRRSNPTPLSVLRAHFRSTAELVASALVRKPCSSISGRHALGPRARRDEGELLKLLQRAGFTELLQEGVIPYRE
jgi:hypothetical protein